MKQSRCKYIIICMMIDEMDESVLDSIRELDIEISKIVCQIRVQDYTGARFEIKRFLRNRLTNDSFSALLSGLFGAENVTSVLARIVEAYEKGDLILVADILEATCRPVLGGVCYSEPEQMSGNYVIEPTASGFPTVLCKNAGIYLHSNNDPVEEARILVDKVYDPSYPEYAVWGCGLGYHVLKLVQVSEYSLNVRIYDDSSELIRIAEKEGIYNIIPQNNFEMIHDPDGSRFLKDVSGGSTGMLMHLPSIKKISDKDLYSKLFRLFVSWNGVIQVRTRLAVNYRKNTLNCRANICECEDEIRGSEAVIVAAGPSVDENMEFLQSSVSSGRKIFAVATILKKLLDKDVVPDYAVVMDSYEGTYDQMSGVEDVSSYPLIVDSTAYWRFAEAHKGMTYIALQNGYYLAEQAARANGYMTFDTGGSVTTLAISIALQLGATKIYLVGVDMAYYDGRSHAEGTVSVHSDLDENMIPVDGIDGSIVYTTVNLNNYRMWIESKLKEYSQIPVYNLSQHGAVIKGTISHQQ